jgi:putative ABC transport system permease protein
MLLNYVKTALRNLRRTRMFSSINILGLAVGMAACLLILHYVRFERSYDRFHADGERIYRLRYERTSEEGTAVRFASCCPPAADFIRGAYPEVEEIARIYRYQAVVALKDRDVQFTEERIYYAEPEFFRLFDLRFRSGDPAAGIRDPNHAFMSASTARKYFGDEEPVGKTFLLDGKLDYTVAGVFEDVPLNSHLKFDILLSFRNVIALRGREVMESWGHTGFFTYLRLKPGADPAAFEKKLAGLVATQCGEMMRVYNILIELKMQPLRDIHLASHYMQEYEPNGNRGAVDFLSIVAIFIIVMAWVNYINLSTARSLTRAREVGLRKVVGASRGQLVVQFFFETALVNLFAVALALLLMRAAFPAFRRLTGVPSAAGPWSSPSFLATVVLMFLAGIFLSGIYPVAALSAFRPSTALRAKPGNTPRGVNLRKALVVFQFVIGLALLTGAFTVHRQISFMRKQEMGFDMERILVMKAPRVVGGSPNEKYKFFKQEVLKNPDVEKICVVTEVPGRQIYWDAGGIFRAGEAAGKGKNYMILGVDWDFVSVFGLKLLAGRNFSEQFPADGKSLILNRTAVEWMGFENAEEAVGKPVNYWGQIYTVVGVLADYHQQSLKAAFEPHIYRLMPAAHPEEGRFALKIGPRRIDETVRFVAAAYGRTFPGNPVEYFFLDDYYNQQYRADERFGQTIGVFSLLAVFVTSLGIFGISSFMALQRTREIGIRKVLGASTPGILLLLARDFVVLVGLSLFVAWPLTLWGIRKWLDSFAYRMGLDAPLFLAPLALVSAITALTITSNVLRAALADPVDAIKHE